MAVIAGIDIETTNSNPDTGGILSIGIFIPMQNEDIEFYGTVTPPRDVEWSYEACKVNGFTPEHIGEYHNYYWLDYYICAWLERYGFSPQRRLLPVGWNVGSFDMQYIRRYLPNLYKRCNYNCIDLNSIVSTLILCGWEPAVKRLVKEEADQLLGNVDRHNALYDAKAALMELELLKQRII